MPQVALKRRYSCSAEEEWGKSVRISGARKGSRPQLCCIRFCLPRQFHYLPTVPVNPLRPNPCHSELTVSCWCSLKIFSRFALVGAQTRLSGPVCTHQTTASFTSQKTKFAVTPVKTPHQARKIRPINAGNVKTRNCTPPPTAHFFKTHLTVTNTPSSTSQAVLPTQILYINILSSATYPHDQPILPNSTVWFS